MTVPVALVTGAASGLGAAIADRLRTDGYDVVGLDVDASEPWIEQADVRVDAEVARVVASAAAHGPLTALVLSAAVETRASVVDCSDEDWQRVIDTNLKGPFLCMRHVVPHMVTAGGGSIVAMGSTLGSIVAPQFPAYCAAKFGLTNLCKQVAIEHAGDSVRVNVLSLGPTDTGLFVRLTDMAPDPEAVRAGVAANLPMKRLGRASEVCGAVSFLLSDAAAFTSGAVIPLDGGLAARRQ
ncbi:MAG TPA: SDR family oxidoreductase [Acidimicrobiales bacterium]|jgi:NAD(P)-dependent dehydrogenase (short-subunit alcohol dehydrogenase family)|nr:SDR family oxidoreductase [Acidimicrobiales bacterium]